MISGIGITQNGFTRPSFATILAAVQQKYTDVFSEVVGGVTYRPSLLPEDEKGAEAYVLAEIYDEFMQLAESLYYSRFLSTATGVDLDRVAAPTLRRAATQAEVTLSFTGTVAATIPAGSIFETEDKRQYRTISPVVLDEYGLGTAAALAVVAGVAGNAPVDSITFIPSFISGLDTVTNEVPATNGLDIETDADFRARVIADREADLTSSLQAIVDAVSEVENVTAVVGFENTGDATDENGLPPGAVEIVTRGGLDQDIAEAIFRVKGAGIGTYGTIDTIVEDAAGAQKHIKHSHVEEVPIYIACVLVIDATFDPVTALPIIKQRFLDYIGGVNDESVISEGVAVGEDVYKWKLEATLFEQSESKIPGIISPSVLIGTTSGDRTHTSVTVLTREKAITDFAYIDIQYSS